MKLPLVLSTVFAAAICHITQVQVPSFWWDIAEDNTYISEVITAPEEQDIAFNDSKSTLWFWDFDWAEGLTMTWTDGEGRWTAWIWNSTVLPGLTGAGFMYDISTENGEGHVGAAWIRERDNGPIIWNCFREGDLSNPLPWMSWRMRIKEAFIGFMANGSTWGFMTGADRIWSHHCNSIPSIGKRYQYKDGREVAHHIKRDPSAGTYSFQHNRVRRSPDWEGFKSFWRRMTDFFTDRQTQQNDDPQAKEDEPCRTIWDSVMRFMRWLFGWNDNDGPGSNTPSGTDIETAETAANQQEPAKDRETLDPKQNEAVPDWEK